MRADATYEVVLVRYGTRIGTRSEVYLNYPVYGQPDGPIAMDYFFWVIRNQERTVLVDTGYSPEGAVHRSRTFTLDPAEAWAALDVDLAAPQTVVVTHAHYDHIGNLRLFPQAQIVIAADEYEFWQSGFAQRTQFHHSVEDSELDDLARARTEGRITEFSDRFDVAPGIEVIQVGGHTPGQAIVRVATDEGDVILASDAIHYYEEYEADMPFTYVQDVRGMYAAFDSIRELMVSATHLVSGHDPDTLARFTPVSEGLLAGNAATIGSPVGRNGGGA